MMYTKRSSNVILAAAHEQDGCPRRMVQVKEFVVANGAKMGPVAGT